MSSQQQFIPSADEIDGYAEKVLGDLLGAFNTYATTMGVTLGWYQALAATESMTPRELAAATDTDERYAREWLEQQTVAGYLTVIDAEADPDERRYELPAAGVEVLANREAISYMAPFPQFLSSLGSNLEFLIEAFRTGEGFGWHQHGDGARCGQAEANRPMFMHLLAQEYLASIDDVHAALTAGARVADVGCGLGWSSIGIAQAYPASTVDGYDVDGPSVARARVYASHAGVADRVRFETADVGTIVDGRYDVVLALECIHDLSDPVAVLAAMRTMAGKDGTVIVMDERVGDRFSGRPDPVEQMYYGFSLLCCLPDGRNAAESAATGTVMRRPTLERYARGAGFAAVEVLPIDNDFFRFYRLVQE